MTYQEDVRNFSAEIQGLKDENSVLMKRCEQYAQAYDLLREQIREMQRHRFGKRSERYLDPESPQLNLFEDNANLFCSVDAAGQEIPEETLQIVSDPGNTSLLN